jgi:LysR family transcriptional activator of nhaA
MDWLNYHHLLYFWTVAREGSIAKAAKELSLAPPTVHAQIRTLEQHLGQQLLVRRGRGLALTDAGRVVLGYADEIFSLGRELQTALKLHQPAADRPLRFTVGIVDSVPKMVAKELLKPALNLEPPAHLIVREGKLEALVSELAIHRLDMVLADHPYNAPSTIRIFHHRLGECGVTFFAGSPLAAKLREGFPGTLDGAPALLPTENTAMRNSLETWFNSIGVRPQVIAECEDSALLKVLGSDARGFFAMPSISVEALAKSHGVRVIGSTEECRERFFAISAERRLKHPAVIAMSETARGDLFRRV